LQWGRLTTAVLAGVAAACTQTLDAGRNGPRLPVDAQNPIIIYQDDWSADWMGEYAVLFAAHGGPRIAGVIVNATPFWRDVTVNSNGWRDFLAAAEASGLQDLPSVTSSNGGPLTRPPDGRIEMTAQNRSAGAELIVNLSRQLATPSRPVAVVSATRLTDLADAYLIDQTVVDRVVVVAALGSYVSPNGIMDGPNGDMDAWSDWIVAQKYRYVQVSGWYDQRGDVTDQQLAELPQNPLGTFMRRKQPDVLPDLTASDQIALLAMALPNFVVGLQRSVADTSAAFTTEHGPPLVPSETGNVWVVTQVDGALAAPRLWAMLKDPTTFAP
jgi:hypothetical protein